MSARDHLMQRDPASPDPRGPSSMADVVASVPVTGDDKVVRGSTRASPGESAAWQKRSSRRNRARTGRKSSSARGATEEVAAIGYVRVSTDEQSVSGAGLTAQREAIKQEVERRGWRLVEVVEDAGFSGRNLRRPGIRQVLAALRDGEAKVLVVAKVDRLSRSMVDFTALMDRATREGWALVAIDLGVDTSTPSGEAMANVMATFSQFERRLIGQRTKEALAVKRAQGVRLGRPPILSAALVERMRRERVAGATFQAIADGLERDGIPTAQGGRRWHAATVRDVIRCQAARR